MVTDRRLNKRQTVQNVKERLKWIIKLKCMTGLPGRKTVDTSAHKLIMSDDKVAWKNEVESKKDCCYT